MDNIAEFRYNSTINGGTSMPIIKSSADLRNNYNKISKEAHESNEPIFITKNGKGDLAIMSMETYDQMFSKLKLYSLISEGLKDIDDGNTMPMEEATQYLINKIKNGV